MPTLKSFFGGKAKTGAPAKFSIASVQILFQTRPGVGDEKIIRDAGDVTLYFRSGGTRVVECRNGVYHFDLQSDSEPVLEFLESQFPVRFLKKGDKDTGSGSIVHWEGPLEAPETLAGVQQRLQLLGYYTGCVDGTMGRKSERAILEFQADEGSLVIDGVAGPKTKAALDAFFEKHGYDSTRKHYLIRRYLARFERARIGDTHVSCPHPDYRGGDNTVVSYGYKISSWADRDWGTGVAGDVFCVGLDFEGLSFTEGTILVPKFKKNPNFGIVTIEQANAKHQAEHKYDRPYLRIRPMVKDGEDTLDLHFGSEKGPVVASLDVKAPEMKQVLVAVHLLTIKDAHGNSAPPWTRSDAMALMGTVNSIWAPMGVAFEVIEVVSNTYVGAVSGTITNEYSAKIGAKNESEDIWKTFNLKQPNRINLYFCESINWIMGDGSANQDILGFAVPRSTRQPSEPIGACVRKDSNHFDLSLTVAHELGHVLDLTCHKDAHSDDDGSDNPYRHDIWSRSRLMTKYSRYRLSDPPRAWQNSTYGSPAHGELKSGAWLTVKKIPMDGTDDELATSRNAASKPY